MSIVKKETSFFDSIHHSKNLPTVFEDNPSDLPTDAIKTDDDLEMETEHESEITKENQDVMQENRTRKKEHKQKKR